MWRVADFMGHFTLVLAIACLWCVRVDGQAASIPKNAPNPENFRQGSGWAISSKKAGGYPPHVLVARNYVYYAWDDYPTGQCRCKHQLWITYEKWKSRGLLGWISKWDYNLWIFWYYEKICEPEDACPEKMKFENTSANIWYQKEEVGENSSADDIIRIIDTISTIISVIKPFL
jgi:hypothetical protein